MTIRLDAPYALAAAPVKTPEGYLVVDARPARTGILEYANADGSVRRELRLPEEVFAADALGSYIGGPITVGHPGVLSAESLPKYRVGGVLGEARADGELVGATLRIEDAATVAAVEARSLVELSCGYTMEYDPTPGEWQGQRYDGQQRNIRLNHIALLPAGAGRSGAACALRMDEGDVEIYAVAAAEENLQTKSLDAALAEAQLRVAQLEAQIADFEAYKSEQAAKMSAMDSARADAIDQVRQFKRACLEFDARKVLGADARFDGMDDAAIGTAVFKRAVELAAAPAPEVRADARHAAVAGIVHSVEKPAPNAREKMLADLRGRAGV